MTRLRVDVVGTYLIAALAFTLSYSNLAALAGRAGYRPVMAHVWPLVVDGLAVVATTAVLRLRASRTYAWSLLAASTIVSVVAGAAAHLLPAGPLPGWAGAAVAVVPPLCLLVAPHLAVQLRRDAADAPDAALAADAPDETRHGARFGGAPESVAPACSDETAATHGADDEAVSAAQCATNADQSGRTMTHEAADSGAALFDPTRDAPARRTRRSSVTPEQRAKVLHLAATTYMSGYEIGDESGVSEASVRRIVLAAGGRDALRAGATPALAAIGG